MHLSALALSLGVALAACGGNQATSVDAPPTVDVSTQTSLAVVATPATVTRGASVTVAVNTTNFTVVDPRQSPPVKPGEGHFHYYLDDAVDYVAGWTPTVTVRTSAATTVGVHTLHFLLANSAHEELTPAVEATTTFTVE
jgi:hypothetical protein